MILFSDNAFTLCVGLKGLLLFDRSWCHWCSPLPLGASSNQGPWSIASSLSARSRERLVPCLVRDYYGCCCCCCYYYYYYCYILIFIYYIAIWLFFIYSSYSYSYSCFSSSYSSCCYYYYDDYYYYYCYCTRPLPLHWFHCI